MTSDERKSPEWPAISENGWKVAAIGGALLLLIAAFFAYLWVFGTADEAVRLQRVQVLTPLGTLFAGLITFATVFWRGEVASRQADQQKLQNQANETAAYASNLERGAKLLSEMDRAPDRLAGLALLSTCIREPEQRFATEAMDVLASYFQKNFRNAADDAILPMSNIMVSAAENYGCLSAMSGYFNVTNGEDDGHGFLWPMFDGYKTLSINGGMLTGWTYPKFEEIFRRNALLSALAGRIVMTRTLIVGAQIKDMPPSSMCTFRGCDFTQQGVMGESQRWNNTWEDCDFSGVTFIGNIWPSRFLQNRNLSTNPGFRGNYFYKDRPPKIFVERRQYPGDVEQIEVEFDFEKYFQVRTINPEVAKALLLGNHS